MTSSIGKKADNWDFSDEQLRSAARAVRGSMLAALDAEGETEHVFSDRFLSRMRELLRRDARRIRLRRIAQRAAVFIIGVIMLGALLAAANPQVRAMFSRLVKREYEDRTEYVFSPAPRPDGGAPTGGAIPDIGFGWLPGECELFVLYRDDIGTAVIAGDESGTVFVFSCVTTELNGGTAISSDGVPIRRETVEVSGREADFYAAAGENGTNKLVWTNEDEGLLFILDSALPKKTMIKIAENITEN